MLLGVIGHLLAMFAVVHGNAIFNIAAGQILLHVGRSGVVSITKGFGDKKTAF